MCLSDMSIAEVCPAYIGELCIDDVNDLGYLAQGNERVQKLRSLP
jgi:hypothetical protein